MFDVAAANVAADAAANVAAGNEVIHISHSFALSLPGLTAPQIRYFHFGLNKTLHFLRIYLHMYMGKILQDGENSHFPCPAESDVVVDYEHIQKTPREHSRRTPISLEVLLLLLQSISWTNNVPLYVVLNVQHVVEKSISGSRIKAASAILLSSQQLKLVPIKNNCTVFCTSKIMFDCKENVSLYLLLYFVFSSYLLLCSHSQVLQPVLSASIFIIIVIVRRRTNNKHNIKHHINKK